VKVELELELADLDAALAVAFAALALAALVSLAPGLLSPWSPLYQEGPSSLECGRVRPAVPTGE
jgi:squalene cyclase